DLSQWFAPSSGTIWKTQEAALAKATVRDGNRWKQIPGADVTVSLELLDFLNNAQQITTAFFANGNSTVGMSYTLRPYFEPNSNQVIQLNIDGHTVEFSRSHQLREDFDWPASSESARQAVGRTGNRVGSELFSNPFSSQSGLWAVFRMIGDA